MKTIFTYFAILTVVIQTNAQCWNKIASGLYHTLAIKSDGTLWAWGQNGNGQLGDGTEIEKYVPTQIGNDTDWQDISAGSHHSMALKTNATLWTWGNNNYGQLGNNTTINSNIPLQVGSETNWKSIDAGYHFCVAIKGLGTNTTLWAWGSNQYGQLGIGNNIDSHLPIQVQSSSNWKSASAGAYHIIALQYVFGGTSTLWSWGANNYGQLGFSNGGLNQIIPIQVGTDTNWASVVAGPFHNLSKKNTGTLWAWGANFYGQLGTGDTVNVINPTQITSDTNWSTIAACGFGHSMAKKTNGTLWVWGQNIYNQLGTGNTFQYQTPEQMGTDTNWANSISAGERFSAALKYDGALYTWGTGLFGELANSNFNPNATVPVAITCPTSLSVSNNDLGDSIIFVYPNPSTSGEFSINSNTTIQEVIVYDILGKQIDVKRNNDSYKINASNGIYYLKIIDTKGNTQNLKLIIK